MRADSVCQLLSRVRLSATPWTVAHQAPLSMEFYRQEHWSGLPFPSPEDLPDPGIKPGSPALWADSLSSELPGKPKWEQRKRGRTQAWAVPGTDGCDSNAVRVCPWSQHGSPGQPSCHRGQPAGGCCAGVRREALTEGAVETSTPECSVRLKNSVWVAGLFDTGSLSSAE